MRRILTRAELTALARELGTRPDWHEPDEQELTATVDGTVFDNAGFWPHTEHSTHATRHELYVTLWRTELVDGDSHPAEALACVNLATLFAWATGYADGPLTVTSPGDDVADSVDEALRAGQRRWERDADHASTTTQRAVALVIAEAFASERRRRGRGSTGDTPQAGDRCDWKMNDERCVKWFNHDSRHMLSDRSTWTDDGELVDA